MSKSKSKNKTAHSGLLTLIRNRNRNPTPNPTRPPLIAALAPLLLLLVSMGLVLSGCGRQPSEVAPPARATPGRLTPEVAAEAAQIEAREENVNKTVWAKEILAEECGRTFETLWDQLNVATNKFAVAAAFPVGELVLGTWESAASLPHGIVVRNSSGPAAVLTQGQWRQRLAALEEAGWQLVQTEFRHQRFESDAQGKPRESRFYFSAHLSNTTLPERAILEGDLLVSWGIAAGEPLAVQRIDASHLTLKTRQGEPPFQLILAEQIAPANHASAIEPLLVYDLDGDGLSEIILPVKNLVYRRQSDGGYQPERLCREPAGFVLGGMIADFDGDGRADLLCATPQGLLLFQGSGQTTFDKPGQLVWRAEPGLVNPMVLTCGDVDGDGDLDIFLGQYKLPYRGGQMPTPYYDANDGDPAYLLLNDGRGHLTDATSAAGLEPKRHRRSLSGSFVDLDADGHLDLVLVSDFAGVDLFQGDGHGHFRDVTSRWTPEAHAFGMAHALADFNADGHLDFFVTGMPSPTADRLQHLGLWRSDSEDRSMRARMTYGNRLYVANGHGGFEQTSMSHSVARSGWSWGCSAFDFDNDGFPDLYIANGMESRRSVREYEGEFWLHDAYVSNSADNPAADVYMRSKLTRLRGQGTSYGGYEKNRFFLNHAGTSFVEVAHLLGVALEPDSRNVVSDDLDGDGRMDLLVTSFDPWPHPRQTLRVYRNVLNDGGNWIGFRFREEGQGNSPVGARVTVQSGAHRAVRHLVTGDSHHSQHANTVHFGLGSLERVDSLEIQSVNGQAITLQSPAINRYHTVRLSGVGN